MRIVAGCDQGAAASAAPEGEALESDCGATASLLAQAAVAIAPHDARSADWFTTGFAEPLTAKSFQRLLSRQALMRCAVAESDARSEAQRRKRARKWIGAIRLVEVTGDDEETPKGLYRGRQITLEVRPTPSRAAPSGLP